MRRKSLHLVFWGVISNLSCSGRGFTFNYQRYLWYVAETLFHLINLINFKSLELTRVIQHIFELEITFYSKVTRNISSNYHTESQTKHCSWWLREPDMASGSRNHHKQCSPWTLLFYCIWWFLFSKLTFIG